MISQEEVINNLDRHTPEQIYELVVSGFKGEGFFPVQGGWIEEPPEDAFIQIYRCNEISEEIRDSIIKGCIYLYERVFNFLSLSSKERIEKKELVQKLITLCRFVDIAKPNELEGQAKSILRFALEVQYLEPKILGAVIRAARRYSQSGADIPIWEDIIKRKNFSAYAFQALLKIDPYYESIEDHLIDLWRHQIQDGWPINVPFLARRMAQQQDSNDSIIRVLRAIQLEDNILWKKIRTNLLSNTWTEKWVESAESSEIEKQTVKSITDYIINKKEMSYLEYDDDYKIGLHKVLESEEIDPLYLYIHVVGKIDDEKRIMVHTITAQSPLTDELKERTFKTAFDENIDYLMKSIQKTFEEEPEQLIWGDTINA